MYPDNAQRVPEDAMSLDRRLSAASRKRGDFGFEWRGELSGPKRNLEIQDTRRNMADEVISNQKTILDNQKSILNNQKTLLSNQKAILDNQSAIKKNQATIKKNQVALGLIVKNQGTILKNQKQILAALKK